MADLILQVEYGKEGYFNLGALLLMTTCSLGKISPAIPRSKSTEKDNHVGFCYGGCKLACLATHLIPPWSAPDVHMIYG